jgi:hypothetical protein
MSRPSVANRQAQACAPLVLPPHFLLLLWCEVVLQSNGCGQHISMHMQLQQIAGKDTDKRDRAEANASEMCTGMLNVFRISSGVLPAGIKGVHIEP